MEKINELAEPGGFVQLKVIFLMDNLKVTLKAVGFILIANRIVVSCQEISKTHHSGNIWIAEKILACLLIPTAFRLAIERFWYQLEE